MTFTVGAGQVYIDTAMRAVTRIPCSSVGTELRCVFRAGVRVGYRYFVPPVLFIGLLAFVAVSLTSPAPAHYLMRATPRPHLMAAVLTRVTLLVLIDATSFPVLGEGTWDRRIFCWFPVRFSHARMGTALAGPHFRTFARRVVS